MDVTNADEVSSLQDLVGMSKRKRRERTNAGETSRAARDAQQSIGRREHLRSWGLTDTVMRPEDDSLSGKPRDWTLEEDVMQVSPTEKVLLTWRHDGDASGHVLGLPRLRFGGQQHNRDKRLTVALRAYRVGETSTISSAQQ